MILFVGQVLNVCFPVRKSIGPYLNKGSLVALQWTVSKFSPPVLKPMKRYLASGT